MLDRDADLIVWDELLTLWDQEARVAGAAQAIYRTLRESILAGHVPPHTRIREDQFAQRIGRSRTPVREAVLRLEAEGLVNRIAGAGIVVLPVQADEVLEVYEVRAVLDGLAASLAAERAIPSEVAHLTWLNDELRPACESGDVAAMKELNAHFHTYLISVSRSRFLSLLSDQVHDRVRRFAGTTYQVAGRPMETLDEHTKIIQTISAGDSEAAGRAARDHIEQSRLARLKILQVD